MIIVYFIEILDKIRFWGRLGKAVGGGLGGGRRGNFF